LKLVEPIRDEGAARVETVLLKAGWADPRAPASRSSRNQSDHDQEPVVRSTIRLPGGFDTAARSAHELAQPTSPLPSWLSRSASASEQIESKPKQPWSGSGLLGVGWFRHSRSLRSRAGSANFGVGDPHPAQPPDRGESASLLAL